MDKMIVWVEDDTDVIDPVVRPLERAGHQFIRLHYRKGGTHYFIHPGEVRHGYTPFYWQSFL